MEDKLEGKKELIAGINHMAWLLELKDKNGVDLYPEIKSKIDAYIAEIIARFGYETYLAWKSGEIEEMQMVKYIQAERARDVSNRLSLERMIFACVAGANNPTNSGHAPKTLRIATKLLKNEEKLAKGVR